MIRKLIVAVVVLVVGVFVLQFVASESGEVVVLSTTDGSGAVTETRLWVVDFEGSQYLRAGTPQAGWFARVKANNHVGVERGAHRAAYTAHPEVALRDEINALTAQKYGWGDKVISLMIDRSQSVPVRLEIYHEE